MIRVSVITAVYNPGPHIEQLLDSLLAQTLPRDEWEVVFVDDDSTDGSLQRVQALAAAHDNVTVLHNTPNSGWPGLPRNMGIDIARGTYVFFADHDDWLPADALHNLCDFADRHDSDVVISREVGHGHTIPRGAYQRTVPNAVVGVDPVLALPTPHKLFRTEFLNEQGIRFPEGKVRLEDHFFVASAVFAAQVVSIYSDAVCYHWVHRGEGNAGLQSTDPRDYYRRDVARVLDVVDANTEPGPMRNRLYLIWYVDFMLRRISTSRFLGFPEDHQRLLFDEVRRLMLDRFHDGLDAELAPADRARAYVLRADRFDLALELARTDVGTTTTVTLTELEWRAGRLVVSVAVTPIRADGTPLSFVEFDGRSLLDLPPSLALQIPSQIRDLTYWLPQTYIGLVARDRQTNEDVTLDGETSIEIVDIDGRRTVRATVTAVIDPHTAFGGRPLPDVTDLSIQFDTCGWRSQRRVPFGADPAPKVRSFGDVDVSAYPTVGTANLSIKRVGTDAATPPQPDHAALSEPALRVRAAQRVRRTLRRLQRRQHCSVDEHA